MKPQNELKPSTTQLMPVKSHGQLLHRMICVLTGLLAIFGALLSYTINPWFAVFAVAGGIGLLLLPDFKA